MGGFRYSTIDGIGVIQMRTTGNSAAICDDDTGWELITDPNTVDITGLTSATLIPIPKCCQQQAICKSLKKSG